MNRFSSAMLSVRLVLLLSPAAVHADIFGTGESQFEIEFVTIGDPGNSPDTTGFPNPAGQVDYVYRIGKYEINREMIVKANAEGELGITLTDMTDYGGNGPDRPATGVSWNEAARFMNWLNTSEGFPEAYKFSTRPGEAGYDANENFVPWEAGDVGFQPSNPFRNSQARYFLPGVHEWYKAAYYDPKINGGAGGYWDYPTSSDAEPTPVASGTDQNTAVWFQDNIEQGPADITQAGGLSPYGVMGLGGNVFEWGETHYDPADEFASSHRGYHGGCWFAVSCWIGFCDDLSASTSSRWGSPTDESQYIGLRVASVVPEPSSLPLALMGLLGLLLRIRRSN